MAERYWPGQDPMGKSFAVTSDATHPVTIVAWCRTTEWDSSMGLSSRSSIFPVAQSNSPAETLQIRSAQSAGAIVPQVRAIAQSLAPAVPVYGVRTMTEVLHGGNAYCSSKSERAGGCVGMVGLILATVVSTAVMSYAVRQRTQENWHSDRAWGPAARHSGDGWTAKAC